MLPVAHVIFDDEPPVGELLQEKESGFAVKKKAQV